ncbi:hypothetical protein HNP55_001708 [Paucibacter oligotrophus]|uniref:TnsA endonuclease-like protein n=1 Tax=Roseateles oligotrophus TaxID=1769250 RepID=A0A840LAN7_9BURK|nr:hypothetical protein [Roseateles oligotrophus]MBB4843189.1 hypothetical protein [Roseateles oligotrophus]
MRKLQAMSDQELWSFALALYNPEVIEVHDQHIMYPVAKQHPLAYHPVWKGLDWPSTTGTFAIAEALGLQKWHPKWWVDSTGPADQDGNVQTVRAARAGAWIGDGLIYLRVDPDVYTISWDIKARGGQHGTPGGSARSQRSAREIEKAQARDLVYMRYMDELEVPIVRAQGDDIGDKLGWNLVRLCRTAALHVNLPDSMVAELVHRYKEAVNTGHTPLSIALKYGSGEKHILACKTLLDHAVWQRIVRVDLHIPVLFDHALQPECSDVLEEFSHWFGR